MALATTTLAAAISAIDTKIVVASATSMAAGRLIVIDQETMQVSKEWVSGTTIPVMRGLDGSAAVAHVVTSNVTHGLGTDFDNPSPQTVVTYPMARARIIRSITATSALTLPDAGSDLVVIRNGTSVITLTIPVPTKDMDGTELAIIGNGAAAHVLTFTGGIAGAGSNYDIITVNTTAPSAFKFIACNGLWLLFAQPSGTLTNVIGAIA